MTGTTAAERGAGVERLEQTLEAIERKLARLLDQQDRTDPIAEHFHLGRVGGSGQAVRALNKRRERELDRTIDRASEIVRLTQKRDDLRSQIAAQQKRPVREAAIAEATRRNEEAIRSAGVGCLVNSPYGPVRVVRINRKSVTIETVSGYREALPWGRIGMVIEETA